jgi:arsenate reductase
MSTVPVAQNCRQRICGILFRPTDKETLQRGGYSVKPGRRKAALSRIMKAKIYHNPRCSKSRETLALLESRQVNLEIVDYIQAPLDRQQIEALLRKLGTPAREIVRTHEAEFKASGLTTDSPADALVALIVQHPKVLQRPIVEVGDRARIGRPPEAVLELIE